MSVLVAENALDWQRAASTSFVPLRCEIVEADFSGVIRQQRLTSDLHVARVTSGATIVTRTPALAASSANDDLHVSLQLGSTGTITQDGRSVAVAPGSLTVYETNRPYVLDYSRPSQHQVVLRVPRRATGLTDGTIRGLAASELGGAPAARLLFSVIRQLAEDDSGLRLDPGVAAAAEELLLSTLRVLAAGLDRAPAGKEAQLLAIRSHIRRHASNPSLTVDSLADRHFLSRRSLYSLLDSVGQSPAAMIRRARVEVAQQLLRQNPEIRLSVLAARSGFGDERTLARAFHQIEGVPPKAWLARDTTMGA